MGSSGYASGVARERGRAVRVEPGPSTSSSSATSAPVLAREGKEAFASSVAYPHHLLQLRLEHPWLRGGKRSAYLDMYRKICKGTAARRQRRKTAPSSVGGPSGGGLAEDLPRHSDAEASGVINGQGGGARSTPSVQHLRSWARRRRPLVSQHRLRCKTKPPVRQPHAGEQDRPAFAGNLQKYGLAGLLRLLYKILSTAVEIGVPWTSSIRGATVSSRSSPQFLRWSSNWCSPQYA